MRDKNGSSFLKFKRLLFFNIGRALLPKFIRLKVCLVEAGANARASLSSNFEHFTLQWLQHGTRFGFGGKGLRNIAFGDTWSFSSLAAPQ
jgi:hypothetical protein